IDFNTTIQMLVKGMDAMGRVKEQWEKMVRFFQMVSNIVKTSLSKTLKDFVSTSEKTQSLSYNSKLFSKDLLYSQAFQASNIASLVHMISATYTEISDKNSCDEAQRSILRLVLKNKDEFERKTDSRLEKIDKELLAILPAAAPEEMKSIQAAVKVVFQDKLFHFAEDWVLFLGFLDVFSGNLCNCSQFFNACPGKALTGPRCNPLLILSYPETSFYFRYQRWPLFGQCLSSCKNKKAMESFTAKTSQSLTTEKTQLVMQPYANWEEYLTPAPLSIAIMGELVFISSSTDFSINKNPPEDGYKYIRYPDSFRACLMQVCNSGWWAFNEAHKNMDQIRLHTMAVPDYMKTAVEILFQGNDEVVQALLAGKLESICTIADDCLVLAQSTDRQLTNVINVIQELLEACINAEYCYGEELEEVKKKLEETKMKEQKKEISEHTRKAVKALEKELQEAQKNYSKAMDSLPSGPEMVQMDFVDGLTESITDLLNGITSVGSSSTIEDKAMMHQEESKSEDTDKSASERATENARFRIEQSRAQLDKIRDVYEKSVENMEKNQKELTDILVTMRNCEHKEMDFNTTIQMLVKGMDAMGRVKEQWEKMVRFFQMEFDIVKIILKRILKDFVSTSEKPQPLSYNSKLFSKQLIYNQAVKVTNIHMISATYTEVSDKYLIHRVSSLGKLMTMDKTTPEWNKKTLDVQIKPVIQPYMKWEEYLTHIPLFIPIMGELVFICSKSDFSINKNPPKAGYKYIRHPDSFHACLMQVCNSVSRVFSVASKNMDQIRLHTIKLPDYMKTAVRLQFHSNDELVQTLLPVKLKSISTIAEDCLSLADSTEREMTDVVSLIQELLEAFMNAMHVPRKELREGKDMPAKGLDAMGRVKEQWEKMMRIFHIMSSIIKSNLTPTLKDFTITSKSIQSLPCKSKLFVKDLLYSQTFQATGIASFIHMISTTYTEVSNYYLTDHFHSLGKLMTMDKIHPEFQHECLKLQSCLHEAQKGILHHVLQNKSDFEKKKKSIQTAVESGYTEEDLALYY
ncbi:hypothetical protein NFI96_001483, partial [Prochilodus magdalenae]